MQTPARSYGRAIWCVFERDSSPPIGALTDCFNVIRGGQFSALNNNRTARSLRVVHYSSAVNTPEGKWV